MMRISAALAIAEEQMSAAAMAALARSDFKPNFILPSQNSPLHGGPPNATGSNLLCTR
jgi:hypothetical protein